MKSVIRVVREANTDFLFAGLLEKELLKHDFPVDVELFIEPRVKGEIYFTQDWRIENKEQAGNARFCFYAEPSQREEMVEVFGKNCAFVTYAADPEIHKQYPVEKIYDVGFIGKPGGDDRDEYLEALKQSGLKVFISDKIEGKDLAYTYSQCKVLFNHIRYVDVNLRFFEEMAIGCQVVNRKWGIDQFATENVHYKAYSSPEEMLFQLKNLIENEYERKRIETNARSHFLSNHTYAHRATSIINHLKEYLCLNQA